MILRIEKIGLSLEADDELLSHLVEKGKSYHPNEFGGFLIGYYSYENTHLNITNSILPKNFKASKYSFERSSKGIEKQLNDFYQENPRRFYVGEWHTHPDSRPIPSTTDVSAIKTIKSNQESCIVNPVLLIVGYSESHVDLGFYIWFENKLYKYE